MAAEAAKKPVLPQRGKTGVATPSIHTEPSSAKASTGKAVASTVLVVAVLLASCWSALYLNLFNIRHTVIGWLATDQSPYQAEMDFLAVRQAELDQQEAVLLDAQWNQDVYQDGLDKRELRLMEWEDDLTLAQDDVALREAQLALGTSNLQSLASIYEKMDAKKAAAVLSAMQDDVFVVKLLTNMKDASVSAILANMDPLRASELTVAMIAAIPEPTPAPQ